MRFTEHAQRLAGPSATDAQDSHAGQATNARHIAVLLLANPTRALQVAQRLKEQGFAPRVAASSEDLHTQLTTQPADLLIIEHELPGFLTGLEIVERLFRQLVRPATILLTADEVAHRAAAMRLKVEALLDSRCADDELVASALTLVMGHDTNRVFVQPRACRIVQELDDLPPRPQLLFELLTYLRMDCTEIPLKDLAADIAVDPKATATLLTLTNSTSTGVRHRITSVIDAVKLLGPVKAISLITSSAVFRTQAELLRNWSEPMRNWYQQRSVLIACTSAVFAQRIAGISPDTAYVLGLLQDLGVLILGNRYKARYLDVTLRKSREIADIRLDVLEEANHQVTHADVSAALLQRWQLPNSIVRLVADHHRADDGISRSQVDQKFLRVMQTGEAVADLSDLAHPVRREALQQHLSTHYPQHASQWRDCIAEAVARTAESCEMFSLPAPDRVSLQQLQEKLTLLQAS